MIIPGQIDNRTSQEEHFLFSGKKKCENIASIQFECKCGVKKNV
jgi:hypothetical protein